MHAEQCEIRDWRVTERLDANTGGNPRRHMLRMRPCSSKASGKAGCEKVTGEGEGEGEYGKNTGARARAAFRESQVCVGGASAHR